MLLRGSLARPNDLERENTRLKRIMANKELSIDALREVANGTGRPVDATPSRGHAGVPGRPLAATGLPDRRLAVVDHVHVIRLANAALDDVRRRMQQAACRHRGRKPDPLYRIRRRLLASYERLDPAGFVRELAWIDAGDPEGEVAAAYLAKELLRETYLASDAFDARERHATFYDHWTTSDVQERERLARTICGRRTAPGRSPSGGARRIEHSGTQARLHFPICHARGRSPRITS